MDALTTFDVIVLLIVALAAFRGLLRGFVGEIASLFAWVAGILAVRYFYTPAKVLIMQHVSTEATAAVVAFVGVFLFGFLVVRLIGGGLSRSARNSLVGPVDRLLGLGFGAAKGVIASALLFLLAGLAQGVIEPGQPMPQALSAARTAPTLAMVSKAMVDFVEERRRVAPDSAAVTPPDSAAARPPGKGGGYDRRQRDALDALLEKQEKQAPGTQI